MIPLEAEKGQIRGLAGEGELIDVYRFFEFVEYNNEIMRGTSMADNYEFERKTLWDIRYVKLHFQCRVTKKCLMPVNKAAALRGGMGEMLLSEHCIYPADRQCAGCSFDTECLVRRIMYSKFDIKPEFVTTGESIGYVICCEDYRTSFEEDDAFSFTVTLFGKTIVYFTPILFAFYALGQAGLGREKARFIIERVTNTTGEALVEGNNVYKETYKVHLLGNYVTHRMKKETGNRLHFHTPLSIRLKGVELTEFDAEAIVNAAARRLYMLDCFEGIEADKIMVPRDELPHILIQKIIPTKVRRYSSTHGGGMYLNGIRGEVVFDGLNDEVRRLMVAAEVMHVGRNTSFGFGRVTVI